MPDKPRRSSAGWRDMADEPGDDDLVPGMPFHYHRPPKWIARCIVGLFALGVLNLAGLAMSLVYDVRQQQYIEGRGEFRDREAARMETENEQRTRDTACKILDALPPSPLLDQVRDEFGCGPGRPLEDFPPDVQRDLSGHAPPPAASATTRPPELARPGPRPTLPPPTASGPEPAPAPTQAAEPAPAEPTPPPPTAAPTPTPVVDVEPFTEPLCDALRICL